MKTGYDQFFKNARKAQTGEMRPKPQQSAKSGPARPGTAQTSKEMAQELRRRMQPKAQKKRSKIPWRLAGTSFIGLAITLFGMQNLEQVEAVFKKIEISFLGQALAEEAKPKEKVVAGKDEKKAAATEEKKETPPAETKREYTQEDIDHFSKLNERKRELDAREAEIARSESELQTQKMELEKRLTELEQTRKNISQALEEKVQADDKKVETLVQMYSNMKPQQAAKVFEAMDEDLAVEILGRMKKKNAAEIMNLVKAEKAQVFSEKYAGYKRK